MQAGFCEVMDTEAMFRKAFAEMQAKTAAAAALKKVGPGRRCKDRRPGPSTPPQNAGVIIFEAVGNLLEAGLGLVRDVADLVVAVDPLAGLRRHLVAQHRLGQLDLQIAGHGEVDDGQEAQLDRPSEKKSHARMIVSQAQRRQQTIVSIV